jgi:hypothetical protein
MTGVDGNGASGYRIVESEVILREVRRLHAGITDPAVRRRYTAALRTIRRRLRIDPREFGEYVYPLSTLQLDVFIAAVAPLPIYYGVHWERKLVIVKNYQLLS